MEKRTPSTLLGMLIAASAYAAVAPCTVPPVPSLSVRELSQNGAIVSSGDNDGLGFVVGWRQREAWVAVPAHVVFGEDAIVTDTSTYRAGLRVWLSGDTSPRRLCDEGPSPPQGFADLTFICVEWTGRPFFNEGVLARRVKAGDELTLVDFGGGQQSFGTVTKAPAGDQAVQAGGDIEAQGLGGVKGQSGSLTANAGGIVGLYLAQSTHYHILSMSTIRTFAEVAGIPWQLVYSEYYDCAAARNVCFTVESEIAPPGIMMRSIFSSGSYPLATGSCAGLPEGRYEIVVPPGGTTCEPKSISVYAAAEDLRLALRCSVALMGTWRTEDGDELRCVETRMGSAQCSGLVNQGCGLFEGTLGAGGRRFSIVGSFHDPAGNSRAAKGTLRWSDGSLVGEVQCDLEPSRPLRLKRVEDP